MAARRSQRRRGRRGEPGTALLVPLALGLGLALACLGLLLAVVSLGSRASLSAQEPAQEELVAEEDQDPSELNPQTEESQDPAPFLNRLVRPRRSAPKGRKTRARRAIAAHYEVHPRPGQDGAQAGVDGTVSGWEEARINSSSPLRYNRQIGEFIVTRAGLYYLYCQSSDALEAWENGERSRKRRAVLTQKQKKQHSVLHLVPINATSKDDSDVTEVMWQPALRRGRGLQAQGYGVRIQDAGVYLLYSQVLFQDVTFTMGQVVSREGQGRQETLFRCIRSMPSHPDRAYNSCYSAGVFHLHQGDILSVIIPRARAKLNLSPHGTFLGFVKL
ncbi:TNFSF12-TNFSF13 protein [Homo sapiens]|uniref:Tumor necrosis factor ligand superfamily member 13 n=3 Tax=Homo sapiens TaxID=9606 RepID=A0A0A6YY99_HUMAN|nr:TNFSF12-TNFSF13 protein [Homo sapiens]AAI56812.1 TNFSF12-TNFSF13 readthrough transcript [synthetic construct]AAL90443.1 TWE-PRIL [Homo sapiens]KAI2581103.1 TNFSF12-TNFSF13 readthrough [Homo sapiens]|eukprot:NP_742086.1 TNFSF12-TNFSF13 protein [Homo sapiens]